MKRNSYRLVRITFLIFTIEWFYRLAANNASSNIIVFSSAAIFVLIIGNLFFMKVRVEWAFSVSLWFRCAVFSILLVSGAGYGYIKGIHQLIVPPILGQPIRAMGDIVSEHSTNQYQILGLMLTKIDTGEKLLPCRISVSYMIHIHSRKQVKSGQTIWLFGIIVEPSGKRNSQETPLLKLLSPSYQFIGRVEGSYNRTDTGYISLLREYLHQNAMSHVKQNRQSIATEGLLESIVFGGNDVSSQEHQIFLQAGVLHVLAASGANLLFMEQMIKPVFFCLFRVIPLGSWFSQFGILGFIWLYTALCGDQPSILRAAWMSSYRVVGHMVGRNPSTFVSLLFSALCMAIADPNQLWSISAILSYVATFAVDRAIQFRLSVRRSIGGPHCGSAIRRIGRWLFTYLKNACRMSLWVELYTAPLCEALFGQWTPYAVCSNLFIEPILSVMLPSAGLWFIFNLLSSAIPIFRSINDIWSVFVFALADVLEGGLSLIAHFPASLVRLPMLPVFWFIAYYMCLALFPYLYRVAKIGFQQRRHNQSGLDIETL